MPDLITSTKFEMSVEDIFNLNYTFNDNGRPGILYMLSISFNACCVVLRQKGARNIRSHFDGLFVEMLNTPINEDPERGISPIRGGLVQCLRLYYCLPR